jgi:4-hydroxy-tetrahydrodipicolinate synthase
MTSAPGTRQARENAPADGSRGPIELVGVFSVLPTPFADDGSLDVEGLGGLVERHVAAGVAGLVMLGVMGEAAELDEAERATVLRIGRERAPATPIVVGISGPSADVVAARAVDAAGAGAAALMVSPAPTLGLAEAVGAAARAGVAVVIQDYPAASGVTLTAAEIAAAAAAEPLVVGVKVEAPPTSGKIEALRVRTPGLGLAGGLGGLFLVDELAAGATATMTGFPMPDRLVEIVAGHATDPAASEATWTALLPLMRLEAFTPFNLAMRKEVWRLRGVIGSAHVRRPGVVLDERARRDIARALAAVEPDGTTAPRPLPRGRPV